MNRQQLWLNILNKDHYKFQKGFISNLGIDIWCNSCKSMQYQLKRIFTLWKKKFHHTFLSIAIIAAITLRHLVPLLLPLSATTSCGYELPKKIQYQLCFLHFKISQQLFIHLFISDFSFDNFLPI